MNCPDIENLIAFAAKPLLEENEGIACHIDSCRKCQEELQFINGTILCEAEITEEDAVSVRQFLEKKEKTAKLWKKLREIINNLQVVIPDEDSEGGLADFAFSMLSGIAAFTAVGATSSGNVYAGEPVKIGFAANCSRNDMNYWYAEMIIPPGTPPDGKLMILLTDRNENMIPRGTLVLLGNELPICEGLAEITLEDFRNSLKNTTVFLRKSNGEILPGELVIC